MTWDELITFVTNNGIAVVLMFYFLRNNNKSMLEMIKQNQDMIIELIKMKENQSKILEVMKSCNKAS